MSIQHPLTKQTAYPPRHSRPPAAYALGFLDCNDISARCMLTIFQFFATKTDASVLRMLNGSPAGEPCDLDLDLEPRAHAWLAQGSRPSLHIHALSKRRPPQPPPHTERLLKPITDYVEAKGGRIHLRSGCK
jgi:zeta-carotene desaturase